MCSLVPSWFPNQQPPFCPRFLANNMEEDDQLAKLDMFFIYGRNMAQIPKFHKLHYDFICCTG